MSLKVTLGRSAGRICYYTRSGGFVHVIFGVRGGSEGVKPWATGVIHIMLMVHLSRREQSDQQA